MVKVLDAFPEGPQRERSRENGSTSLISSAALPSPNTGNWRQALYLGIDPGANGALASLEVREGGSLVSTTCLEGLDELATWRWFKERCEYIEAIGIPLFATIERQTPRPTMWVDKRTQAKQQTVLRSTVLLYGSYMLLRGLLTATEAISFQEVLPQEWQADMGIVARKKGEPSHKHKARLKQRAQQLFPRVTVTLDNADALLIAEYCRRMMR